jgi:hypothetical protein
LRAVVVRALRVDWRVGAGNVLRCLASRGDKAGEARVDVDRKFDSGLPTEGRIDQRDGASGGEGEVVLDRVLEGTGLGGGETSRECKRKISFLHKINY